MLDAHVPLVLPPATGRVSLTLAPLGGIVSIAAYRGQAARLGQALGVALPATPLRVEQSGVTWLWSGPDSWLALADNPALVQRFDSVRDLAAVADQSHGRIVLHVTGPGAAETLARLVPIDLHPTVFAEDRTALTLAGSISVQLWRREHGFALACFSSFGRTLVESLAEAGRDDHA